MSNDRPSIEDVFDYYNRRIIHRGGGQWSKAECPLLAHEDQNPSASVNIDAGKWTCFSCGNAGDIYDIIEANEESCAGFAEAKRFAEEHFASGGGPVRQGRRSGEGLLVRPTARKGARSWSPPWGGV